MDMSELAQTMLEWEATTKTLDDLTAVIQDVVLELGETQTAGNVRASYSKGRRSYDYREAADGHIMVSDATISLFTTTPSPTVDWRGICTHAGIEGNEIPYTQGDPKVTVKIV